MLNKTSVHCFYELGDKSIDEIIAECKHDFIIKCLEMVKEYRDSEQADYYLFGLRAYETFNGKGRYITYQDKAIEYQSLETDIRAYFEHYLKSSYKNKNIVVPDAYSDDICEYLLQTIKNEKKTKEDLGLTLTKPEYKRYEALFGLGEFPFLMITIVRIGNKRYYFYQIER